MQTAEYNPKQVRDQQDVDASGLSVGSVLIWNGTFFETRAADFTDLTGQLAVDQLPAGTVVTLDSIDASAFYFFDNDLFLPRLMGAAEAADFLSSSLDFADINGTLDLSQLPAGTAATVDSIGVDALFFYTDSTNTPSLLGAADTRTFLGVVIGTNVQAWDADLDALAALSGTHNIYYRSAANTWSSVTIGSGLDFTAATLSATATGSGDASTNTSSSVVSEVALFADTTGKLLKRATGSGLAVLTSGVLSTTTNNSSNWDSAFSERRQWDGGATNLVAATGRTSLGLVIGTNVQAWDADLDAIAALSGTNNIYYRSAANTWSSVTIGSGLSFSSGTLSSTGGSADNLGLTPTAVKTANYTAAAGDFVPVDTTSGNVTITFPTAPADKSVLAIKHVIQGGSNTVSLALGGSDVFNKSGGSTSGTLTLVNQAILLQYKSSGAIWYVVSDDLSLAALDSRYVPISGALGTPSSGTLTNCTGLPIAGLSASTSTAIGVGSIELGNASDCTLARSVTARLTVEGTNVVLQTDAITILAATTSGAIGVGTIELGHASDTTIARSGAGAITVEGTQVILSGAALGTPASGTLTNCTGLPVAGVTGATTNNFIIGVASVWTSQTPAQARTALGLVIGTNVQAWDADLDSWAAITRASGYDTFATTPSSANLRSLMTDEIGTGACVFDGATLTQLLTLATCGSSLASVNIPAGTVPTTPNDGDFFADANCFYGCTDAGNPGLIPLVYTVRATSIVTQANDANPHAVFTTPTNGRITLETGTYRFHGMLAWTAMSATSGNLKLDILGAGTATTGSWLWEARGIDALAGAGGGAMWYGTTSASSASIITAQTATGLEIVIDGSFQITGAGTVIPTQTLVTAAAAVLTIGSYMEFWRVGSSSMTSVGQWD